jgi:biopolymer transport protein ExbD
MRWLVALAVLVGCDSAKREVVAALSRDAARAPSIRVERDRVVIDGTTIPDEGGAIAQAPLRVALEGRQGETVALAIAPDAPYGRLRSVVDVVFQAGLSGALDVGKGGSQPAERPVAAAGSLDAEPVLVLSISTDAIFLGAKPVVQLADLTPGDDIPELAAAIGALTARRDRILLHADERTPGAVVVRAIGTARRAGVADVSFVWRPAEPPAEMPMKRAPR